MGAVWTEEAQFDSWLEVELAACEAWAEVGEIPAGDVAVLRRDASFSVERIHEIEETTRHDVVAFTRAVGETLGEEKKWIHYGLTSSDVVDTALALRLAKANVLLRAGIRELIEVLARRAREHRDTVMVGRTHGVHAEPTSFGLKLALYYAEMKRNEERFGAAADGVRFGKVSGAVGTFANTPMEVERITCERLGLQPAPISTQILQRDRHAHYMAVLALIGATLEKLAVEIRSLQKSEVREVEEFFHRGQKGSSSMPHKRNPVGSENIAGCARLLRGYMMCAYENVALWHERDISHSAVERVIVPDATIILDYMLHRMTRIIDQLTVYPENMLRNLDATHGLIYSQRVMLKLIDQGLNREEAYDLVQPLAMKAWEERRSFRSIVEESEPVSSLLSKDELDDAFDPAHHIRHAEAIFKRVGL